jgi:hypothetical protein
MRMCDRCGRNYQRQFFGRLWHPGWGAWRHQAQRSHDRKPLEQAFGLVVCAPGSDIPWRSIYPRDQLHSGRNMSEKLTCAEISPSYPSAHIVTRGIFSVDDLNYVEGGTELGRRRRQQGHVGNRHGMSSPGQCGGDPFCGCGDSWHAATNGVVFFMFLSNATGLAGSHSSRVLHWGVPVRASFDCIQGQSHLRSARTLGIHLEQWCTYATWRTRELVRRRTLIDADRWYVC